MFQPIRCLQIACAAAVLLAAGSARANAQANKYTVCKDGSTWMTRGHGVCGQRGGVDPKRSDLANQTLNPYLPRELERLRRREFERRMMEGVRISDRSYKHTYESNGSIAKKVDEGTRKAAKADAKIVKQNQKAARKP